ncbi:MAG: MFS transporter [Acidimicrobiales bacterium]|jgi:DHA1 family multidrug resistance protein-like MFS transporter
MTNTGSSITGRAPDRSVRLIRTLTLTILLQWMGATALIPMLPVYIRQLHGSDALAGVVMAAFFAAGVLSQYPVGRLADRIGRRPVLVGGLVTYGVASLSFLLPITAEVAIALRALQGVGAGAATVASLAMIASSVPLERRGRAFASIYAGELAGMAIGPLVGSIVGVRYMGAMFLASGLLSFGACLPALRIREPTDEAERRAARTRADGTMVPLHRVRIRRPMAGALICGATLGLASGVYDICWTLLLLSRGASGLEIGISWTLFAVPFVLAAKPSGWLADHMDRRKLVLVGIGTSTVLCASYPFISSVPALVLLGASEALGFAAAMPAVQSLLTEGSAPSEVGRIQGLFATSQTAFTAVAAAAAGAAFAVASWLPFVTAASIVTVGLVVVAFIWRTVPGRVSQPAAPDAPESVPVSAGTSGPAGTGPAAQVLGPAGAAPVAAQVLGPASVAVKGDVRL